MPPENYPFWASKIWAATPLAILILVGLVWLWRQIRLLRRPPAIPKKMRNREELSNPSLHFPTPDWHEPLKPVVNQTYRNETVELDGKSFNGCRFANVTFVYNGTKPTQFTDCSRTGENEYKFQTDNPAVMTTVEVIHWLRTTSGDGGKLTRDLLNKDER